MKNDVKNLSSGKVDITKLVWISALTLSPTIVWLGVELYNAMLK